MLASNWSPEKYELVETLTCRVRVLSLVQLQNGWRKEFGSTQSVIAAAKTLMNAGLVQGDVWRVCRNSVGDYPLCRWQLGDPEPDLESIEHLVRSRWQEPPVSTPVIAATHKASRLFGSSGGGFPPANHQNHDLLLSEVYLSYRTTALTTKQRWMGEDAVPIAERGIKNPDAYLFNEQGEIDRVIESAGRYSLKQLTAFHNHCSAERLAYELW